MRCVNVTLVCSVVLTSHVMGVESLTQKQQDSVAAWVSTEVIDRPKAVDLNLP